MSSTERPKPEYGEYATSEEQAAALERSGVRPELPPPTGSPLSATERNTFDRKAFDRSAVDRKALDRKALDRKVLDRNILLRPGQKSLAASNPMDRVLTIFLLSFGLVYVVGGAATYLDMGTALDAMMAQLDIGDYTVTGQTLPIGVAILVSQVVIWVVSALWAFRRVSRGQIAWWVPVTGAALAFLVSSVLLAVLLLADPGFIASVSKA